MNNEKYPHQVVRDGEQTNAVRLRYNPQVRVETWTSWFGVRRVMSFEAPVQDAMAYLRWLYREGHSSRGCDSSELFIDGWRVATLEGSYPQGVQMEKDLQIFEEERFALSRLGDLLDCYSDGNVE